MTIIQLINRRREVIGNVVWNAPDDFHVTDAEPGLAAGVSAFLAEAVDKGLILLGGDQVEDVGTIRFVDRSERITVNDKRFLRTFVDKINHVSFGGQRVFGLLKEEAHHG